MPGLVGLVTYILMWDLAAKLSRGRIRTISSDVWAIQRTPGRVCAFLAFWAVLTFHVLKRPKGAGR